ncbi:MBOAT family O-acyltransferase [Devosia beringensis]|uniref:MBOAT family O-acyltransferase n=1 Tax=Devosia beringensis TaxID=2657486 RepID=UPI00186BB1C5|nr:MBOAT family protein [Devosia beringensis]
MIFTSIEFLVFFVAAATGYALVPPAARWIWLLATSIFFYAYAGPTFLLQIVAAATVSYGIAFGIERAATKPGKQTLLTTGIVLLLANLCVFKYAPFFNSVLGPMVGWSGADHPLIPLLMPLGISFYTFQLIGYLIDIYRGDKAERHFGLFSLYVMFFPKVISGPIERSKNLLPQLHALPNFSYPLAIAGMQLMLWGAFKKVVVADRIAPFVDRVYSAPQDFDGVATMFATWLYAFQLYFDFSGYTDMALGASMVLGIKLMQNFDRPYFAVSVQDFWKRWHISLTSWLTDYVYTPITRSKWIRIKLYNLILIALMSTFLISGFWHGSQWNYVAWGGLHGAYIVISLLVQKPWNKFAKNVGLTRFPRSYTAFKIARTFSLVCFAYILFRAANMGDALYMMGNLWTGWDDIAGSLRSVLQGDTRAMALSLLGIVIVMAPECFQHRKLGDVVTQPLWRTWGLHYALALSIVLLGAFDGMGQQFIYFRF